MITIKHVSMENRGEVKHGLRESGYISATEMYAKSDEELIKLIGIRKLWLPGAKRLRQVARQGDGLSLKCYCLEYNPSSRSYWYNIEDLKKLYEITIFPRCYAEKSVVCGGGEIATGCSTVVESTGGEANVHQAYRPEVIDFYPQPPADIIKEDTNFGSGKPMSNMTFNPIPRPCWFTRVWRKVFNIKK